MDGGSRNSLPDRSPQSRLRHGFVNAHIFRLLASTLLFGRVVQAAVPVLEHLFPAAVQSGVTNSIALVGTLDPWPPRLWADDPGIRFVPGTNSPSVEVLVDPKVPAGAHWIRAFSTEGASTPRLLIVTPHPLVLEREPNDDFKNPQFLATLPVVVEGRLEKTGDVDSYSVPVEAGQTLVVWVDAYTLMTPLDPALRVLDESGDQVAWNHDSVRSLDPALAWTATRAGRVVVQVFGFAYPADSDVRFAGNLRGVYRLHVSTGPFVRHTLPLGAKRTGETSLQPVGWNLASGTPAVSFRPEPGPFDRPGFASFQPVGMRDAIEVPLGDGPETLEVEPNDTAAQAGTIEVPSAVSGDLNRAGDEDRFRFFAKAGQVLLLEVMATRLGFPLDAWLKVEDAQGKELAHNDDATGSDPKLIWTAPKDGAYLAVVGNLLHTGGSDLRYRLDIHAAAPSLSASAPEPNFGVEAGKTNEFKVTLTRAHGFTNALAWKADGLPAGVRLDAAEVAPTSTEATLRWIATPTAAPFNGVVHLAVHALPGGAAIPVTASLAATAENNGVPQGFSRLIREQLVDLWLTVRPAVQAAPAAK